VSIILKKPNILLCVLLLLFVLNSISFATEVHPIFSESNITNYLNTLGILSPKSFEVLNTSVETFQISLKLKNQIQKDSNFKVRDEGGIQYYNLQEYFVFLEKYGLFTNIKKLEANVYFITFEKTSLILYSNNLNRDDICLKYKSKDVLAINAIELNNNLYISKQNLVEIFGFNDTILFKNIFLNLKKHQEVFYSTSDLIYTRIYEDYGKEAIDLTNLDSKYFYKIESQLLNEKYLREDYRLTNIHNLEFKVRTKYIIMNYIFKLDELEAVITMPNYDWHIDQHETGKYFAQNCVPASVMQAFNLVTLNHKVDTNYIRTKLNLLSARGMPLSVISDKQFKLPFKQLLLVDYNISNIDALLKAHNLVIFGVKSSRFYEDSIFRKKSDQGHALTLFGYIDYRGKRIYKIQDTGNKYGSNLYCTHEDMVSYIVSRYGGPIYTNYAELKNYLFKNY